MITKKLNTQGFTFVEIMIVFGIITVLTGFALGNLVTLRGRTSLTTVVSTLINDIKDQQNSAMQGQGQRTIYLNTNSYVLNDFTIDLEPGLQLTTTFPQERITFASVSGEINGFVPGSNSITIQNTYDQRAVIININRLGVITSVL